MTDHITALAVMQSQYSHIRQSDAEWEALEAAKEALRAVEENEPLTLDELRGMDGEPVWNDTLKEYMLVNLSDGRAITCRGTWRPLDDRYCRRKPGGSGWNDL